MDYYKIIKEELINNEVYKKVKDYSKNKSDLRTYYNVGKILIEAQGGEKRAKYGDNLIKEYSKKLSEELGKGYSQMNLKNMRKFYLLQKRQTLSVEFKLTWSHYIELLKFNDTNEIKYYIDICEKENLSVRELREKIKLNEYERLDENTKLKLINSKEENKIGDFIKHPIVIKTDKEIISEKILHQVILENIVSFMKELGEGYSFIDSEYKIKVSNDKFNYIDLLLFNYIYNCFIVVELKVTELKKDHIGQIQIYMNYIDENIKQINQNQTIGIIICREDNSYVIRYCSNSNIYSTTYKINLDKVNI